MDLKIKRVNKDLPLPKYKTKGAVAIDLYSRIDIQSQPKQLVKVPLNVIIDIPKGHMLLLASRSSTPVKKDLIIANGVGIIDQDYNGPEDEISAVFYNYTEKQVKIEKGERVAQGIIVPIVRANIVESDVTNTKSRGGFGSTGRK